MDLSLFKLLQLIGGGSCLPAANRRQQPAQDPHLLVACLELAAGGVGVDQTQDKDGVEGPSRSVYQIPLK